jgi:L-ascorbate metabolism protein UlaG (beta-lactamase superfamily)
VAVGRADPGDHGHSGGGPVHVGASALRSGPDALVRIRRAGAVGLSVLRRRHRWGSHFAKIGRRFPHPRLAILPVGGFKPPWYMREQHLGPADAVAAHRVPGASTSMPIHFGTLPNGDEGETEAPTTLRAVLARSARVSHPASSSSAMASRPRSRPSGRRRTRAGMSIPRGDRRRYR